MECGLRNARGDSCRNLCGVFVIEVTETSFLCITEKDAGAIYDIRCELDRARACYPPFPNLYAVKDEIFNRARKLSSDITINSGMVDDKVRYGLVQIAVLCLRALTENDE